MSSPSEPTANIEVFTHIIHAHGAVLWDISHPICKIPKNTFVLMMCAFTPMYVGNQTANDIWKLKQYYTKNINNLHVLKEMIEQINIIMKIDNNNLCMFAAGGTINDFSFIDKNDFLTGMITLPYKPVSQAMANAIRNNENVNILEGINPHGTTPLAPQEKEKIAKTTDNIQGLNLMRKPISQTKKEKIQKLSDVMHILETEFYADDMINIVLIASCTSMLNPAARDLTKPDTVIVSLDNIEHCMRIIEDTIKKNLESHPINMNTLDSLTENMQRVKLNQSHKRPPDNNIMQLNCKRTKQGGAMTYKIKTERESKRRYIIKSKQKWYLDENRAKYRYVDPTTKFFIFLLGGAATNKK